jgi:hypothetical protein
MKRTSVLFFILIVFSISSKAQKGDSSIYTYSGRLVNLQEHKFRSTFLGNLQGMEKESYQGLDIFGDYIVSCQNTGIATIYKMDSKQFIRLQGPFHLASYHHNNHSNVASFGTTFFAPNDPLPLLYISQCHREPINGLKDVLYVERFAKDLKSSTLVQTIYFKDIHHLFGYALQWVIDRDNGYLYGYGNTIDNENPLNRHRIVKFRIPTLDESTDGLVTLNDSDILENYLIEDTYARPFNPIGQGLCIKNGCLYMPTGVGNKKSPSILYIWNLETRHMQNIVDLTKATTTELEDCAVYQGDLIIQAQKGLFRLSFKGNE